MVCYDRTIFENLESEGAKILRKSFFKVVQMKFRSLLAMHITNKKLFNIFTVGISSWNMILISNDFWHNRKMYYFVPYNVLQIYLRCLRLLLCSRQGHKKVKIASVLNAL